MTLEHPLERTFFFGTGYVSLDAADTQTILLCINDVSTLACMYMIDHEPVVCVRSASGHLLAAVPWPEGAHDDAAAVRGVFRMLSEAAVRPW